MGWAFATINGRLAEIFFDNETKIKKGALKKIQGHCYVKMSEYKTKKEKRWIKEDTKRNRFSYRNKKYRLIKIALRSR